MSALWQWLGMSEAPETPGKDWPDSVNYLLRTTQQHHVQLSLMADQKASILVGASFVVFTLALRDGVGTAPSPASVILAASSFLSAVLAVLAIIPSTGKRPKGMPNLLFFGGFTALSEEAFVDEMLERTKAPEEVYRLMLRDIHQNGTVLYRKKYRFLSYAFKAFLIGLILSFAAFVGQILSVPGLS